MWKLFTTCLFPIAIVAVPVVAQTAARVAPGAPSEQLALAHLQARFAKLQQVARPDHMSLDLQLVDDGQDLLGQRDDGIIRLPQNWAQAAPDRETLDFLMLMGLANATLQKPQQQGPSTATKIVTSGLGLIAHYATKPSTPPVYRKQQDHSDTGTSTGNLTPALRALNWATKAGGCEARIIAGLQKLENISGTIGRDSRLILKALGPVAWTPDDRCAPPKT